MSKRLIKRFRQFTDSPYKFAGWLAILLTTLVLAVTVYFFYDTYPKDGRPMDIELPIIPSLGASYIKDPREVKIDILKNSSIRIGVTIISPALLKMILEKCVKDFGPDIPIRIRADRNLSLKQISSVITIVKDVKFHRVSFAVITKYTDQLEHLEVSILPPIESKDLLRIELKRDQFLLNGKAVNNADSLRSTDTMCQLSLLDPDMQCLIIPDPDIILQRLIDVIYECIRFENITVSEKIVPDKTGSNNISTP